VQEKYANLQQKYEKIKTEKQSLIKLTVQQAQKIAILEKKLDEMQIMVPDSRPAYYRNLTDIDFLAIKRISDERPCDVFFIKQWFNVLYKNRLDNLRGMSLCATVTRNIKDKLVQGKTAIPAEEAELIRSSFFARVERCKGDNQQRDTNKYFNKCVKEALRGIVRALDSNNKTIDHDNDSEYIEETYEEADASPN
jgi:hypothetical protein